MSLRVLEAGLYSLVVDAGRPGQRSLGVPLSGPADSASYQIGNALVGNPPDAAALEIALAGPTLQAEDDTAAVVCGAPFELSLGTRRLEPGCTFNLRSGDVLRIGGTPTGSRAYLCVRGGIEAPLILGSRSALAPLRAGDRLPCPAGSMPGRFVRIDWRWDPGQQFLTSAFGPRPPFQVLRILPGPQADWFPPQALAGRDDDRPHYRVTPASNRMGLRLEGPPLPWPDRELVSEAVCPGSVQVTRDGQCIVLGVDGQTIGGYPKVAQVISADLDRLGQLRPGESVCFVPVSLAEAEALYRQKRREIQEWLLRLRLTLATTQSEPTGRNPAAPVPFG